MYTRRLMPLKNIYLISTIISYYKLLHADSKWEYWETLGFLENNTEMLSRFAQYESKNCTRRTRYKRDADIVINIQMSFNLLNAK